jgi:hypothetical protein
MTSAQSQDTLRTFISPSARSIYFKEIWVHPSACWLAIMADLEALAKREERR